MFPTPRFLPLIKNLQIISSVSSKQISSRLSGNQFHRLYLTEIQTTQTKPLPTASFSPTPEHHKNTKNITRHRPSSYSFYHSPFNAHLSAQVQFSTVAVNYDTNSDGPTPKKRKTTLRKRDPLTVTAAAAARIKFLLDRHNESGGAEGPAVGIRLGTKKRGCNGLSYTLNYAYEGHSLKHSRDEAMVIPENGILVFVEPMALMNVIGTKMDFVDNEMISEFTFINPNSKGECGCGESFNV